MRGVAAGPQFYVALTHTDNLAYFDLDENRNRMSILRLFPDSMRENLLFSLSYDPTIHKETALKSRRGAPNALGRARPMRLFADCGAFQYRAERKPCFEDGEPVTAESTWDRYRLEHLGEGEHEWKEILLCSPDHIVSPTMSRKEAAARRRFTLKEAPRFLELASQDTRATAVGVIHGPSIRARKAMLERYLEMGYDYVALGGMVPLSTNVATALDIIAGIKDIDNPVVDSESILARCRRAGVKLHILGLNSPDWWRWWLRLGIDSFDGSKLSTDGARHGWYWVPLDGRGAGCRTPSEPTSANDLYRRIAVKKMEAETWVWRGHGLLRPERKARISGGVRTRCDCPACTELHRWKCASTRCWMFFAGLGRDHASDPRMMGSTEHNMGRTAHNAHTLDWMVTHMRGLVAASYDDASSWRRHWRPVPQQPRVTHYVIPCTSQKSLKVATGLAWSEKKQIGWWKRAWERADKAPVSEVYTGRSFEDILEAVRASEGDWQVWVVSAGGGLLKGPSSSGEDEDDIPGYEVHCFPNKPMTPARMRRIWEGREGTNKHGFPGTEGNAWQKLAVEAGDEVVIALPKSYQQAVLPSLPEHIPTGVNVVHVGSCRVSGLDDVQVLAEHPRVREVVNCGFNMLRTRLLTTYIAAEDGVCELQRLDRLASERKPEHSRAKRRRVNDDELKEIIRNLDADITRANSRTVHHLRHNLQVAASSERVTAARKSLSMQTLER